MSHKNSESYKSRCFAMEIFLMWVKKIQWFSWLVIMLNPKLLQDGAVSASLYYRKIIGVDRPLAQ